jgi:hypothetical protein
MKKLYGFGDSFTEGQPIDCTYPPFIKWKESRGGDLPKAWIELLGEKLNMEVINYGRGGNSNQQIFADLCQYSHHFNEGDIVIVNWTYKHRFRWAAFETEFDGECRYKDKHGNPTDTFRRLSVNNDNVEDFIFISKTTKDEIIQNRMSIQYSNEIYGYENLIEQYASSKKFNVYFWSADDDIINKLPFNERNVKRYICANLINETIVSDDIHYSGLLMDYIKILGGKTISEETKDIVLDRIHFGESGHKVQADLFYNHIMSYKTNY